MEEKEKDFAEKLRGYYARTSYVPASDAVAGMAYKASSETDQNGVQYLRFYLVDAEAVARVGENEGLITSERKGKIFRERVFKASDFHKDMLAMLEETERAIFIRKENGLKKGFTLIPILPEAHSSLVKAVGTKEMPFLPGTLMTSVIMAGLKRNRNSRLVIRKGENSRGLLVGCVGREYQPNPVEAFVNVMGFARESGLHFTYGKLLHRQHLCRYESSIVDETGFIPGVEIRDSITGSGGFEVLSTLRNEKWSAPVYLSEQTFSQLQTDAEEVECLAKQALTEALDKANYAAKTFSLNMAPKTAVVAKALSSSNALKKIGRISSDRIKAKIREEASLEVIFAEAEHEVKTVDGNTDRRRCLGSLLESLAIKTA